MHWTGYSGDANTPVDALWRGEATDAGIWSKNKLGELSGLSNFGQAKDNQHFRMPPQVLLDSRVLPPVCFFAENVVRLGSFR